MIKDPYMTLNIILSLCFLHSRNSARFVLSGNLIHFLHYDIDKRDRSSEMTQTIIESKLNKTLLVKIFYEKTLKN